jgi:hypothetical protein
MEFQILKKRITFLHLLLSVIFISCEKIIDVDLNEANPRLVIDGNITDQRKPDTLSLQLTGSFFGDNDFKDVSGAEVTIFDNAGNSEKLTELTGGKYITQNLPGVPGRTYSLHIKHQGKHYSATSSMPQHVKIDSLRFRYRERTLGMREGIYATVVFTDPPNQKNYYLLKGSGTSVEYNQTGNNFLVLDDEVSYNNIIAVEIPFFHFNSGMATIELHSIDRAAYDYYNSLNAIIQSPGPNPFSGVPQNPVSNIQGDALGFFGAHSVSVKTEPVK